MAAVAEKTDEKTELKIFTCYSGSGNRFTTVMARDVADADEATDRENILFIQGGKEDVKARKVKEISGKFHDDVVEILVEGSVCTIAIDDPVVVAKVAYLGRTEVNGDPFLAFKKNDVSLWVFVDIVQFLRIGGQRV